MYPVSTFQWYSFTGKFLEGKTVGLAVAIVTEGGSESPDINKLSPPSLPRFFSLPPSSPPSLSLCNFK